MIAHDFRKKGKMKEQFDQTDSEENFARNIIVKQLIVKIEIDCIHIVELF